jgi:hypothetical protein
MKGICKRLSRILKEVTCKTNKLKRFVILLKNIIMIQIFKTYKNGNTKN